MWATILVWASALLYKYTALYSVVYAYMSVCAPRVPQSGHPCPHGLHSLILVSQSLAGGRLLPRWVTSQTMIPE